MEGQPRDVVGILWVWVLGYPSLIFCYSFPVCLFCLIPILNERRRQFPLIVFRRINLKIAFPLFKISNSLFALFHFSGGISDLTIRRKRTATTILSIKSTELSLSLKFDTCQGKIPVFFQDVTVDIRLLIKIGLLHIGSEPKGWYKQKKECQITHIFSCSSLTEYILESLKKL